jgi:hypothetical protein
MKNMPQEYTKEQLWKLYEKLPGELREAIFSEETADNIEKICLKNKVAGGKNSEIARYIGRVLLGILPPEEFKEVLQKEMNLEAETVKNVFHEINRFIFNPVKQSLEQLYKTEAEFAEGTGEKPVEGIKEESTRRDAYKEPIE